MGMHADFDMTVKRFMDASHAFKASGFQGQWQEVATLCMREAFRSLKPLPLQEDYFPNHGQHHIPVVLRISQALGIQCPSEVAGLFSAWYHGVVNWVCHDRAPLKTAAPWPFLHSCPNLCIAHLK